MNWHQLLTAEVESAYHAAEGLMSRVTDAELGWKPKDGSNWLTMGQLLRHIESACGSSLKGFATGDWGLPEDFDAASMNPEDMLPPAEAFETTDSVAASLERLKQDKGLALKILASLSEADLATRPAPAPWDPRPMPLGQRLLSMVNHLNLHKAQLFYYLKLNGQPVNTGHLWGM